MNQDEHTLLHALAGDVARHFPSVVTGYQQQLYAFAVRLLSDPHEAEDLVQDALVRAYVALLAYPADRIQALKLRPWLYKIVLNEFRHRLRATRLHVVPLDLTPESTMLALEDPALPPDLVLAQQERRQDLAIVIGHLPELYRVAIICYYFEHLSYQEIADLLGHPVGTVKSAVFRGVKLLRTMLTPASDETEEGTSWNRMLLQRKV